MSVASDINADIYELKKQVKELADAVFYLTRDIKGCGKNQFTLYGQCMGCKYQSACQMAGFVRGGQE